MKNSVDTAPISITLYGDGADDTRLDVDPYEHRQRGEEQLHQDPGRPDEHALPLALECGCGGSLHIGNRKQHQQHDADLVHLAAPALGREGMAELVQRLHQRVHEPEREQVRHAQRTVGDVLGEFAPMR